MKTMPFLVAAAIFLAAAAAGAQDYRSFEDDWARIAKAPFSLGPFRIFPQFQVKNLGLDNNIYYEDKPLRDFTVTFSPEATAYLPVRGNALFYIRDNPEYRFYLKEKGQRAFTNSYDGGVKLRFFQRIVVWADYVHRQYKRAVSVELTRPTKDLQEGLGVGLFVETARKTAIGLSWKTARFSYEDISLGESVIALADLLNRRERAVAMQFYYQIFPGAFAFANVGYSKYTFDKAASNRDSRAAQAVIGLRFPLLGRIRGMFSLGYRKLIPRDPGKTGYAGLYGESELSYRSGKIGLRLGFNRGDQFSYFETAFLYLGSRVSGGVSYYLTNFLRLDYNIEFGVADYPDLMSVAADSGSIIELQRLDHQIFQVVGLVVRVYRTWGIGLTFNSSRWTSNVPGWDRRREFVGANITTQF